MNIKTAKISDLEFDPENARRHSTRNLNSIVTSLKTFGQRKPIVVRGNTVIAGNGTLAAAMKLDWDTIDVVEVPDDWDDATAKAFALADNKSAELAEWDDRVLTDQLNELADSFDLEKLGFTIPSTASDIEIGDADVEDIPAAFGLVIECENEADQAILLERFILEGLRVRALM